MGGTVPAAGGAYPYSMHALLLALLLVTEQQVRTAITPLGSVDAAGIARLKAMGPEILPHLAHIYSQSSEDERATIAWIFYSLGMKSPDARKALLQDIHTQNQKLRLQTLDPIEFTRSNPFYVPSLMDQRSPINWVGKIEVPTFLSCSWQDEQTGGDFASMLECIVPR